MTQSGLGPKLPYPDRKTAGETLAAALTAYKSQPNLIVLALPRGGVPVAFEVARRLNAPLDLMLVRKLGLPGQPELAMGAIAYSGNQGGDQVLNEELVNRWGISAAVIAQAAAKARAELARRARTYRGDRPEPDLGGRTVILIDDGLATGATMRAAIQAAKQQHPAEIVVAVPVAPPDTVRALQNQADAVICPATPEPFWGVGQWYHDFTQTTHDEVRSLLSHAWGDPAAPQTSTWRV